MLGVPVDRAGVEDAALTLLAQAVLAAAGTRTESRGCHVRTDFPAARRRLAAREQRSTPRRRGPTGGRGARPGGCGVTGGGTSRRRGCGAEGLRGDRAAPDATPVVDWCAARGGGRRDSPRCTAAALRPPCSPPGPTPTTCAGSSRPRSPRTSATAPTPRPRPRCPPTRWRSRSSRPARRACWPGCPPPAPCWTPCSAPTATRCSTARADGDLLAAGDVALAVRAPVRGLLTAERTALNLVCHLSGVATATRAWVDAVAGTGARIRDTRKTLPGLRLLEKYAVRCGGGVNHRLGLGDAVLIKDNHVAAAGSVGAALAAARRHAPDLPCEVEVDTLDQLDEVLALGAELVLLDNFTRRRHRRGRPPAGRAPRPAWSPPAACAWRTPAPTPRPASTTSPSARSPTPSPRSTWGWTCADRRRMLGA